jgi:N-acylneuraminate cytidylyltransferase/CMP-N,N'-diacetyllegionaminic acid synthase
MGHSMKRLCTICARGGSKGVPNKNIRQIGGKPLITHSVVQAQLSGLFEAIAVSSDSPEILNISKKSGVDYLIFRPQELASDSAPKLPAIQHCVNEVERISGENFDVIVDLDVTSPLRLTKDIEGAVRLLEEKNVSNVITGCPARRSPYFNLVERDEDDYVRLSKPPEKIITRRQDAPECFDMNASIYVWKREGLIGRKSIFNADTLLFVMPEERSIDVDHEWEFEYVEFLFNKRTSL